jgi:energy-coupling factor transporter ATP-binding protein EcfA2
MVNSTGSTWKRWEPHAHTPETALNDQFPDGSWDAYIAALEGLSTPLAGMGVTDYFTTEGYRKVRDYQRDGRLRNVLLFPNIEMRLAIGTKDNQAVNVHVLVSPEDPDHLEKINEKLARLTYRFAPEDFSCTADGLRRLGRAWHAHSQGQSPSQVRAGVDDAGALRMGANQFKIDLTGLCQWRDADSWLKANTLLAMPNGNDGAGGLPRDDGTFAATREALRRTAHVILSSNGNDRAYWLGHGTDGPRDLERKYGGPKPCLHGSDAHGFARLTNPGDRMCWIKAEATWRGFLQVLVEPEDRLFIGPVPPDPPRTSCIARVEVTGDPWCPSAGIDLNPGLVAIVGSRGSGKTALADLIAYGAESYERGPASFLGKAKRFIQKARVAVTWGDGSTGESAIESSAVGTTADDPDDARSPEQGRVLYLSQHFVESLCDPDGRRDRLRAEVERIVFQRLDPDERLDASTFQELLARETEALHETKRSLEDDVRRCSELIAQEHATDRRLPEMRKKLAELAADAAKIEKLIAKTAPPGAQQKQRAFAEVQAEMTKREEELKALAVRAKAITDLQLELRTAADEARRRSAAFLARAKEACPGLTAGQEEAFALAFAGDYEAVLRATLEKVQVDAARLRGPAEPPFPNGTYMDIKARLAGAQKALRDAGVVEKQLADLTKAHGAKAQEHKALAQQIEYASKARDRIREHQAERFASYKSIVEAVAAEETILRRLYGPLEKELGTLDVAERSLALAVCRRADIDAWVRRGERLFDMRKRHAVTEPGALYRLATDHLLPAWEGNADPVAAVKAVQAALGEIPKLQECFLTDVTLEEMAAWLYSTDHVRVDYAITYDGVDIDQLSPGTRGVVLLIIYLRLDTTDDRPLVIDQPEENLDPKSVFTDLVRFFKDARKRRQIIMVTHNANLVVNADADQVLIAEGSRGTEPGPPVLAYRVAVLEDEASQQEICAILEGGVEAFRQRDRRYRISMGAAPE